MMIEYKMSFCSANMYIINYETYSIQLTMFQWDTFI